MRITFLILARITAAILLIVGHVICAVALVCFAANIAQTGLEYINQGRPFIEIVYVKLQLAGIAMALALLALAMMYISLCMQDRLKYIAWGWRREKLDEKLSREYEKKNKEKKSGS